MNRDDVQVAPTTPSAPLSNRDEEGLARLRALTEVERLKWKNRERLALPPVVLGLATTAALLVLQQPLPLVAVGGILGVAVGLAASLSLKPTFDQVEKDAEATLIADSGPEGEKRRRIANMLSNRGGQTDAE